ncbi:MAG: aminotransferase class V-fold PLP-dependent enzyme, partial [Vibrio sp.]
MPNTNYRQDFPALSAPDAPIYLDSAATSQKPLAVIEAIDRVYRKPHGNVHRGNHGVSGNTTADFEATREQVQRFINAPTHTSIIWTRGATESLNLIAHSYAGSTLKPDDEILVSEMEHHANIVPWQLIAEQTGAKVIKVPM